MKENTVDSVVCDPPYGIAYDLAKKWDAELPSEAIWRECHRVLKPGGFILATASARMYHHLAARMEAADFLTHPMMAWLYGTGFPKGTSVSRQFDRVESGDVAEKPDDAFRTYLKQAIRRSGHSRADLDHLCGTNGMIGHYTGASQPQYPSLAHWRVLKTALKLDRRYDRVIERLEEVRQARAAQKGSGKTGHLNGIEHEFEAYVPKSPLGRKWDGFRYGLQVLKPAIEPIYMGQKPGLAPITRQLEIWGVGAINLGATRHLGGDGKPKVPTNVLTDGSAEVASTLEGQREGASHLFPAFPCEGGELAPPFFYVPKPGQRERGAGNTHPTVKPVALMEHLVRLITPPDGTCLDPFMGSGTTGVACKRQGYDFVGIERERSFFKIAVKRIEQTDPSQREESP